MTCAFGPRKLKINKELDNEGFLYINNTYKPYDHTKTFKIGEITDTTGNIVCPGEIISIMDYEEFESNKDNITQYSSVLKGKKIRIYMIEDDTVMISRECEIYPDQIMSEAEIKKQINFDLLDKNNCYYATIITNEDNSKQIILTYMTDRLNPKLENINLCHDLAFMHHLDINKCKNKLAMETFKTALNKEPNGLMFYRNDGQRFEFWTSAYSQIKCQERPYNINPSDYYVLLLNKYPVGKSYSNFFKDLHCDVDIYITHYPEDKNLFDQMEELLNIYANFNEDSLSSLSHPILEDSVKIEKIKKLLYIDIEGYVDPVEIINILRKFKCSYDKNNLL
jgi:hypothetical protein